MPSTTANRLQADKLEQPSVAKTTFAILDGAQPLLKRAPCFSALQSSEAVVARSLPAQEREMIPVPKARGDAGMADLSEERRSRAAGSGEVRPHDRARHSRGRSVSVTQLL